MTTRRTNKKNVRGAILWDLKLRGDVNENHAGGNASRTLFERIEANGYKFEHYKQFSNTLSLLTRDNDVKRLSKGAKTYALRLMCPSSSMPENPFGDVAGMDIVPYEAPPAGEFEFVRAWPVSKRLELIAFASQSVNEDMTVFKTGVAESL